MLVNEAGHSITIRTLDGVEHPLLRSDLVLLFCTGRSLMPEGLEGAITPEQMRDMIQQSLDTWGPVVQAAKIAID